MAITSLAGRYLQDSFKFVTQNSQSAVSPDKWIFADGEGVPITWIDATASWAASASVAVGLVDNIWVRSSGINSAVLNDSSSRISIAYGSSSIAYGHRTTASGDFSQAQGSASIAYGTASFAAGLHVIASGSFQTVFGKYNLHNNTADLFVIGSGSSNTSRADTFGVSPTRMFASNSVFFPGLSSSLKEHLVVFDIASGQLFYWTASDFGGGSVTLPGGPNTSIQFNSASTFSGSNNLTYNFNTSTIYLTGSQTIQLSGSSAALQIKNICDGTVSTLSNLPFVDTMLYGSAYRLRSLWIPSGSYGQLWNLASIGPAYVFDVTSSKGDLQFRTALGKPGLGIGATSGRAYLGPTAIYAANLDKLLVVQSNFYGDRINSTRVFAYSASVLASQTLGSTSSYSDAITSTLYSYTSSLIGADGSGSSGNSTLGIGGPGTAPDGQGYNLMEYTPSGSSPTTHFYSVGGYMSSGTGNANNGLLWPGTQLSASIAAGDSRAIQGTYVPVGFYMSTFEQTNPTTMSVDFSSDLIGAPFNIAPERLIGTNYYGARVYSILYNPITERIYCIVTLPGAELIGGGAPAYTTLICELDNTTSPPTLTNVTDSDTGTIAISGFFTFKGMQINITNQDLLFVNDVGGSPYQTKFTFYDATATDIDFYPLNKKAEYTVPFYSRHGSVLAVSNSFYMVGSTANLGANQTNNLVLLKIESGSSGYTFTSNSYSDTYNIGASVNFIGTSQPTFASASVNKIFTYNTSDVGPVSDPFNQTNPETPAAPARNRYTYALNTSSLALSATFSPYDIEVGRIGNFVEFIGCDGDILSYVNAEGEFVGTASYAIQVVAGGSIASPGNNTEIIYNDNGNLEGASTFTFNNSTNQVNLTGAISASSGAGTVGFYGTSSWAISSSVSLISLNVTGSDEYIPRFSGSNHLENSSLINRRRLRSIMLDANNTPATGSILLGSASYHVSTSFAVSLGTNSTVAFATHSLTANLGTVVESDHSVALNKYSSTAKTLVFRGYSTTNAQSGAQRYEGALIAPDASNFINQKDFSSLDRCIVYDSNNNKLFIVTGSGIQVKSFLQANTSGPFSSVYYGYGIGFVSASTYTDGTAITQDTSGNNKYIAYLITKDTSTDANIATGIATNAYGIANNSNGLASTAIEYVNTVHGIGSYVRGSGSFSSGYKVGTSAPYSHNLGVYNAVGRVYTCQQLSRSSISLGGDTYNINTFDTIENNDILNYLTTFIHTGINKVSEDYPVLVVIPSLDYCGIVGLQYDGSTVVTRYDILPETVSPGGNNDVFIIVPFSDAYDTRPIKVGAYGSTAIGVKNITGGSGSFVGGENSKAVGNSSFAFGSSVRASGSEAVAFGSNFTNQVSKSFAVGYDTQVNLFVTNSFVGINTSSRPFTNFTGARIFDDLWVDGNSYLGTSLSDITRITGSLIVSNSLNVIGTGRVTGSLIVSNSLTTIGTNITSGSLIATGSFTLIGNQTITGSIIFASASTRYFISGADYISFNPIDQNITTTGQVGWDVANGTLDLGLSGSAGNIPVLNIGQQQLARVYNAEASNLTRGQVVYISGSQGNRIAVKLASATYEAGSANTLGLVYDRIGAGEEGYIITEGPIYKLNTNTLTAGATLYLSTTAGAYTQTAPAAPNHRVILGFVERVDATVGSIYVKVDNGYEIDELHNVLITQPTSSGDLFILSGSVWTNSRQLTGSYWLTGSLTAISGGFTGSLFGTSSWATTSSRALTAVSASFIAVSKSNTDGPFYIHFGTQDAGFDLVRVDNDFSYNAFTNQLTVTGITASLFGTATTASFVTSSNVYGPYGSNSILSASYASASQFAVTASYSLNASSTSPSGSDKQIQFNDNGNFGASPKFTYDKTNETLDVAVNKDFTLQNGIESTGKYGIRLINSQSLVSSKQFNVAMHPHSCLATNSTTTDICKFDADINIIGNASTNLRIDSFKCDYSLTLINGGNFEASRVGTLYSAWDLDGNTYNPILSDTSTNGDQTLGVLSLAAFTISIGLNGEVVLSLDLSSVGYDVAFNGIFTVFTKN